MTTLTFFIAFAFIYALAVLCTLVDWRTETEDLRELVARIFGRAGRGHN